MEIGIIAEGKGDCAVLQNILMGIFEDLDAEDIRFLRPEFITDNTDKSAYQNMTAEQFGSWTLVKKDCETQHPFINFLDSPIAGEKYIVIQIDTAECEEVGYDVERPAKTDVDYCEKLRNNVVDKINEWLQNNWQDEIFYAICIEEMEAWIHTLYENKDTSKPLNAKETFQKFLNKKRRINKKLDKQMNKLNQKPEFNKAQFLSKDFKKITSKKGQKVLENNESLKAFILSLDAIEP